MLERDFLGWLPAGLRRVFGSAELFPSRRIARAEADLETARATQMRLLDALDTLPEGIVILDADGRYVAWNKQYLAMYPNTADLIQVGATLEDAVRAGIARGEYPQAAGREEEWLAERLVRLRNPGPRYEQSLSDGRCILMEDRPMTDGGLVSLRVDITEMKQREATFRLLFESNPLPMLVCRLGSWEIAAANDAAVAHYGYTREEMTKLPLAAIHCAVEAGVLPDDSAPDVAQAFTGRSFKHVRRNGEIIEVEVRASGLNYENQPSVLLAVIDITERRRSEFRVVHLARHDSLTGLPNRFSLTEEMQHAVKATADGEAAALLFLDLDKFKAVNDTLGHAAGDDLLREVARRLRRCVRDQDTVARLGGDEYGILLRGDCTRLEAAMVARRILADMQKPVTVQGRQLYMGVSIGIAMLPDDGGVPDELFRCSDVAMYAAKQDGRGAFRFFEPEMDEKIRARSSLETDMKRAIANGELDIYYQPLVALDTGDVTCMEALVRWHHPQHGLVSPVEFIPIAEETGMIVDLGAFVLRQACRDAVAWPAGIKVAVNVSALELDRAGFVERLKGALEESGLAPRQLQIEVTETAVMSNIDNAIAILTEIRSLGVEVAMDDFGTGYSSLCSLRTFPFDKIKIDRAFIRDASISADGHDVLSAIVGLVQALGMTTTAEGVESIEQRRIVEALKCNEMQGYLFSPAKPLHELRDILAPWAEVA
ncbi:MAG: EAL domain-containing protein [Hyphomicrobiaceae bacterium]|nr:EAL domain-containing protein [Hyphomicrobiaceae bacterium]